MNNLVPTTTTTTYFSTIKNLLNKMAVLPYLKKKQTKSWT